MKARKTRSLPTFFGFKVPAYFKSNIERAAMTYNVDFTFEFVDTVLKCDHSNKDYSALFICLFIFIMFLLLEILQDC